MEFLCDNKRHLICVPYSKENLHKMAEELGICNCWFHNGKNKPHYDISLRRIDEITSKCRVVSLKEIVRVIRNSKKK